MTNPQTMVERVAQAVRQGAPINHAAAERIARAAIEAMREPTDEMTLSVPARVEHNRNEAAQQTYNREAWRAMITAALEESR